MKSLRLRFTVPTLIALTALLGGCATSVRSAPAASFVVVRHAEKADDGSRDPPLAASGATRAQRLAAALEAEPVAAVYATAYRRTQQTAAATADQHGVAVTTYDARQPAVEFAAQLRRRHATGTVLVVGHSNTAPQIAAALCGCDATPLGDSDYGRVYRIRIDPDGGGVLQESTMR